MKWKCIQVSGSIANFKERLLRRYSDYDQWRFSRPYSPTIFFGMYRLSDYLRFVYHQGPKSIFWCGSDILAARKGVFTRYFSLFKNVCENDVERERLARLGIQSEVHPMLFDDPAKFDISFVGSKEPHVYICAHEGREDEYGVSTIIKIAPLVPWATFHIYGVDGINFWPNVKYHGKVPNEVFEREIRTYQGCIRLNKFDGASEVMTKSVLLGQYPISFIRYPFIDQARTQAEIIHKLLSLRQRTYPNPYRNEWYKILCNRLEA